MAITYKPGLELWVWDSGQVEGFALYVNGDLRDEQFTVAKAFIVPAPDGTSGTTLVVEFSGVDGGATKVVDTNANNASLEHQDSGMRHAYVITPPLATKAGE